MKPMSHQEELEILRAARSSRLHDALVAVSLLGGAILALWLASVT
jgi:hypothetical protein